MTAACIILALIVLAASGLLTWALCRIAAVSEAYTLFHNGKLRKKDNDD